MFAENASFYILLFACIGLLISSIYQLLKKRWIKGIITGFCFFGIIAGSFIYTIVTFFIEQSQPDKFADNLYIPSNINIENPIDLPNIDSRRPDSLLIVKKSQIDFILYNSFQPGLFEYDLWIDKIESGKIYLKAYEITNNFRLSEDRLKERSFIQVFNQTDNFIRFGSQNHFTIYEGDWGKPYSARFEVWFIPANGEQERKLIEKNYKIEGWMR